ncbi:DUF222 domain-containing protein [Kribbella sp. NBC_00662]|uniref:HNH endonuclease signature motif containing protein n=1 Tax=Kribbella sp. NBC_00662 TaxID=2975969 RepID=UPI00324E3EC8
MPGFGAKANITVTIDLQDLKSAAADAIGDTVYGDGLSAAAIRRLACDARVIPLVLGTNSEPLDVGRSERLVTRAMRRALNTRDRGCVVCGAPPIQCDAHHLVSWIDGGETKISNLVLLCRRHHIDLHAGEWTITILNGEVHVARPTWADPPPQPPTIPKRPLAPTPPPQAARHSPTPSHNPSANTSPQHDRADRSPTHVASDDDGGGGGPTMHVPRDDSRERHMTNAPTPSWLSSCDATSTRRAPEDTSTHGPSNGVQLRDCGPTDREANERDVDSREVDDRGSTERSVARAAVASVVRRSALGRQLLRQLRSGEGSADVSGAGESGAAESRADDSRADDSGVRKSGVRKSGVRESGVRESGVRESGVRESGVRESGVRESGVRESGVRESGVRESGVRESGVRESGVRESGVRESGVRESGVRESGVRESGVRESGVRESGVRESGVRESGADQTSASLFREAAYQAIWGEPITPQLDRETSAGQVSIAAPRSEIPLDPRTEQSAKPPDDPVPTGLPSSDPVLASAPSSDPVPTGVPSDESVSTSFQRAS